MAKRFTVAELVVGVKADIKQMKIGLRQGLSEIKGFSGDIKNVSNELSQMGKGLGVVSGVMVALGGKAVKVFADLEQAIANTASVTSDTTEKIKDLESFARKMGKTTIFTATQAGDAMYYLASAGYSSSQIFSGLDGILALAAATQFDLAETTAVVVSTLRAFSLEADQAGRIANVFAAAISSSQATMFKLQESMRYIAPITANLNYSIEDTVAALSLLFNSGLEASMSGTQLRMALTRLQKPTAAASKAMHEMGIKANDLNPAFNSLVDILMELEAANAGAAKNGAKMAHIFGVRAVNAMNILVRNGSAALTMMTEGITNTTKAADMQQRQIDSLKGTWRLMTSAMQETSIIIGTSVEPVLKALMESVRQLNLWFSDMPALMQKTIVGFGSVTAVVTGVTSVLLLLASLMPRILKGSAIMAKGWRLFGGKLLGVVGIIITTISALTWLISLEEREARQRKANLLDYKNYLGAKEKDAKATVYLVEKLKDLSNVTEDNVTKLRIKANTVKKLNDLHPGLINSEEDLASQMGAVSDAALEAADSLEKINIEKEKMIKLNNAVDLAEAEKELKKITDDIDSVGFSESANSMFKNFTNFGLVASAKVKSEFSKDLRSIDAEFAGSVINNGVYFGSVLKRWHPSLRNVRAELKNIADSEGGVNRLLEIQDGLRNVIHKRSAALSIELSKTGLGEELISNVTNSNLSKKKSIVDTQRLIKGVVDETVELYKKEAEVQATINDLKGKQKAAQDDINDTSEPIESKQVRAIELAEQRVAFEILTAGMQDRIRLREETLNMEYSAMVNKLMDEGNLRKVAETRLVGWLSNKRLDMERKNSDEIASLELSMAMKGSNDVFKIRMMQLEKWKREATREAISLNRDTNAVVEAAEREKSNIIAEEERTRAKLVSSLNRQLGVAKVALVEGFNKKEVESEKLKYQQELDSADDYLREWSQKVKKGLVAREKVDAVYKMKQKAADESHSVRMGLIERESASESRKIAEGLSIAQSRALADVNIEDPLAYELEQENISYRERLSSLQSFLDEQTELVIAKKADQASVNRTYDLKEDALALEHESKKAAIRSGFREVEMERELGVIDQESVNYDERLRVYFKYIEKQLQGDNLLNDERLRLMRIRDSIEDELLTRSQKRQKEWAKNAGKTFSLVGDAIGKTGQGATDAWKESLKSFVKMIAASAKAEAGVRLATSIGNPIGMAKWGAALVAISAAEQVALGRIDAAQYGAEVRSSGLLQVHKGETVVPSGLNDKSFNPESAGIVRKTWGQYANNVISSFGNIDAPVRSGSAIVSNGADSKTINMNVDLNINAEGSVIYPAGVDAEDAFYERVIKPAEERFEESLQTVIESVR